MDDMYRTLRTAIKHAKEAHNSELRTHVIFREVGLWRIKPVDEIAEIDQRAIYGWTVPKWYHEALHPDMEWHDLIERFPFGDDCFIRPQFRKRQCYCNPSYKYHKADPGLKLYNTYTQDEINHCVLHGQLFD